MNHRIQAVIKASGLKKFEFAKRLCLSAPYISELCSGKTSPSDRTIADICREFGVSEAWLRTGEGEMLIKKEPQPLDELLSSLLDGQAVTDADRVLVKNFLELSGDSRKAVIRFVQKCAGELSSPAVASKEEAAAPAPDAGKDVPGPAAPDIAAELAELKRKNQELAAEIAAMKEEDALLGLTGGFSASPSASAGSLSRRTKK